MAGSGMPPGWLPPGFTDASLASMAQGMGMDPEALRAMLYQQAASQQSAQAMLVLHPPSTPANPTTGGSHGTTQRVQASYKPVSTDDAVLKFEGWGSQKLASFKSLLEANGIHPTSYDDLATAWSNAVTAAANSYAAYKAGYADKPLTPEEVIARAGQTGQDLFGGTGDQSQTNSFTNTNTSVDTLSPQEGRGLATDASQAYLGRDPRKGEASGFTSGINAAAAANPNVTTQSGSTTTTPDGQSSSTSSTDQSTSSSGGIDQAQYAREWAQSRPDYSEYQAVSKYWVAMMQALGEGG